MTGKPYPESTPADRALITTEEGRVNFIYDDGFSPARKYIKGTAIVGNLTGGVGHLISRGKKIVDQAAYTAYLGKTIPNNVIDQWLDDDLNEIEAAVARDVKVPLAPQQRGTLYSFGFNVGVPAFEGSGVLRQINAGNLNAVPKELAKWNETTIHKNGVPIKVVSNGLKRRRAMETAYWLGAAAPAAKPKTVVVQPQSTEIATPAATPTSPMEVGGLVVGGITGASSFATAEGYVAIAVSVAIILAVLVGAAILVKRQFFAGK